MTVAIVFSSFLLAAAVLLGGIWIGPAWDELSGDYVGDLSGKLRALGFESRGIQQALRWWGIALVATAIVLGIMLRMIPVAIGVLLILIVAPRYVLDALVERRRILLRDQLVRATVAMANASRAGLSLPQGLDTVAQETPQPLCHELRRIVRDYQSGRTLPDAIREVRERLDLEAFHMFSAAILTCLERGGKITLALEKISAGLQELQRLQRKLEADTAANRRVALLLALFPFLFLIGFTLLDPVSMSYLYETVLGQFILLGVGGLVYVSVLWCFRILKIDF